MKVLLQAIYYQLDNFTMQIKVKRSTFNITGKHHQIIFFYSLLKTLLGESQLRTHSFLTPKCAQ